MTSFNSRAGEFCNILFLLSIFFSTNTFSDFTPKFHFDELVPNDFSSSCSLSSDADLVHFKSHDNPFDRNSKERKFNRLDWEKRIKIGEGGGGKTYKVWSNEFQRFLVVKVHYPFWREKPREIYACEHLEKKYKGIFFPTYYGSSVGELLTYNDSPVSCWYHVMECFNGDLQGLLDGLKKNGTILKEHHIKKIVYEILRAVQAMHAAGMIHRDLKPANILLSESSDDILTGKKSQFRIVLCDFGLVKPLTKEKTCQRPVTPDMVSQDHRPLEACLDEEDQFYGPTTDTWSIGVIFLTLLNGYNPFWNNYWDICSQLGRPSNVTEERSHLRSALNTFYDHHLKNGWGYSSDWEDYFKTLGVPYMSYKELIYPHRDCLYNTSDDSQRLSQQGFQVLSEMLSHAPWKRRSTEECLRSSYWNDVREAEPPSASVQYEDQIFSDCRGNYNANDAQVEGMAHEALFNPASTISGSDMEEQLRLLE